MKPRPDKIVTGPSTVFEKGSLYVAVWRQHKNHKGEDYSDIDEELYATPDEWREIIRQISALLDAQ